MRIGLLHHDLASLIDIDPFYRRLPVELPTVERVPRGSPHPCRGGERGSLGNHDLFTIMDIHAALRRLPRELHAFHRVPLRSPHPCRGGAGGGVSIFPRRKGWSPDPAPYPAPKRGGEYLGGAPPLKRGGESMGANLTKEATDCREVKVKSRKKERLNASQR